MLIRIYQIAPELDTEHLMFDSLDTALKKGPIHSEIYECVYEKDLPIVDPERVYQVLNTNLPPDYHGRSLSVSDIVEFERNGKSDFFYCDSFGFKPVKFDKTQVHPTPESRKPK